MYKQLTIISGAIYVPMYVLNNSDSFNTHTELPASLIAFPSWPILDSVHELPHGPLPNT